MANTMLKHKINNNKDLLKSVKQLASNLQEKGLTPEQYLEQLVKDGRFSQEQVQKATETAKNILGII